MNRVLAYVIVSATLVISSVLVAAQVNLIQYEAGTPIKADEVNQNFRALDEAKQNRVIETCDLGSAIRVVNEDGTVECEGGGPGGGGGDITAVNAGEGLVGGGETDAVSLAADFAGAGSATTVARSDHHHLGQTWTGANDPLVITGAFDLLGTDPDTTGAPLILNNSAGDGLRIENAASSGVIVDQASASGFVVGFAGGNAVLVGRAGADGVAVTAAGRFGGFFAGDEAGVQASGTSESTPDVLLAGNNGRIRSSPDSESSDIYLTTNDAVVVELDADGGESGQLQVRDQNGDVVFQVHEDGDVEVNGTEVHASDRNLKENLDPVNPQAVLSALAEMPIHRWNFRKDEADTPHIGPMAQDFYAAFALGSDERYIASVDADGVAMVAIQGLYATVQAQQHEIRALKARLAALETARSGAGAP